MKRLLIGYDGSECATAALDDLRTAGLPHDLDVKVLTVADVWLPAESQRLEPVYPNVEAKAIRRARDAALNILNRAQTTAAQGSAEVQKLFPNWRIQAQALADSPAWAIARAAREFRADLVVMGSHGRSLLERFFLGSVAQKVAAEAHCSVRIYKPRPSGPGAAQNILVALDGSKDSEAAVRAVLERRWPANAHFKLVTVVDDRLESAVAWPGSYARQWVLQLDGDVREAAFRMIEKHASDLYGAGLTVDTHLSRGEPKQALLNAVRDLAADCIFIGAHGLHHEGKPSLGTVASAVAARAHCTVEIVRAGS
jgi:nucleotide-binding universal stress UspA family protein